ncbi:MAG TPA: peptidase M56, partial [Alistipes sp.]|nr:peptidase M56 [Alistipes sp.]
MLWAFTIYSLETGACLAGFYLFFKLLLSRETF